MTETLPNIDFHQIRTYDGAQSGGFEQLAVELFSRGSGAGCQLIRVNGAGGDGGVESYVEVPGKGLLGMQAKFFDKIGRAQWTQIEKSVKTALTRHPSLKEYHVYVPLDRTPGQIQKWAQYVDAWHGLPNGGSVKFIWKGRYEIEQAIKAANNLDLLYYWFGAIQFTNEWMDSLLKSSLCTLGPRYQPSLHVEPKLGSEVSSFMWSPSFERALEQAYVLVAEACHDFAESIQHSPLSAEARKLEDCVQKAAEEVIAIELPVYGHKTVTLAHSKAESLRDRVAELQSCLRIEKERIGEKRDESLELQLNKVRRFLSKAQGWSSFLERFQLADSQFLLVTGEAGSGKSHLLAHCAVGARQRGQPILLLLGEQFLGTESPLSQLSEMVGWSSGWTSLLAAINVAGSLARRPALLIIDAVNESSERKLWKSHLHPLAAALDRYPHVRLIISCRSDFVGITLPTDFKRSPPNGWDSIEHRGLGDVLTEAVARYFATYGIKSSHFPPLLNEFRNPLFLDTFCRAFENQALPDGPITLEAVMERRITRLAEKIREDIDCDEHHVRCAIEALAGAIRNNNGNPVDESIAREAVEPYSPSTESSRSLYTHLLSNGFVVSRIDRYWEEKAPVVVRFAFERFSDYFIAQSVLADVKDVVGLRALTAADGRLAWLRSWSDYLRNRGVARALAIIIPCRFRTELIALLPKIRHRGEVLIDLLESLPWRSGSSITKRTEKYVFEASRYMDLTSFIEALLLISTVPGHPFNAHFLHDRLMAMPLARRDRIWTLPVGELASADDTLPRTLVEWAVQVSRQLVSDDQASLVATVLLWYGSSNLIDFRARAGRAAIHVLIGRPHLMAELIEKFDTANDPYVVERAYGVACGVAMREPAGEGLRKLAETVYRLVFAKGEVRPHLLQRDYAQTLLLAAQHRGCFDSDSNTPRFTPPFASRMPRIIGEAAAKRIENYKGWRRIVNSVRPEGMGMYGDFGRYVMGTSVHKFLSMSKDKPIPSKSFDYRFDARIARRWVLQRVKALGWTSKLFGEYDGNRYDYRSTDDEVKIERIGKKYQWIALHELLGYLSDHYHMMPNFANEPRVYQGAWQIRERNFDPSDQCDLPSSFQEQNDEVSVKWSDPPSYRWCYSEPYPDPFANPDLVADRPAWVRARPADPVRLLTAFTSGCVERWIALDGFWRWNEPQILRFRRKLEGRCETWMHFRSWLVRAGDAENFIHRIRQFSFWGHGCEGVSLGHGWIGEYPYGAAFNEARDWCEQPDEWTKEDRHPHVRTTCIWDRRGGPIVPSPQLCDLLDLRWSGEGAAFCNRKGAVTTASAALPNVNEAQPCMALEGPLQSALSSSGFRLIWAVVGERRCWNGTNMVGNVVTQFSGVYTLSTDGINGGLTVVDAIQTASRP